MRGTLPGAARSKYPKGYLGSLIRLRGASSLSGHDLRVVRVFGVANLACNLGHRRVRSQTSAGAALSDEAAGQRPRMPT